MLAPGTGRVDDEACAIGSAPGVDLPAFAHGCDARDFRLRRQRSTASSEAAKESVEQAGDVDVQGTRLHHSGGDVVFAQCGAQLARFSGVDLTQFCTGLPSIGQGGSQACALVVATDPEHGVRCHECGVGKTVRRLFEKASAGPRELAHRGAAVAIHQKGGRTSGGVVAGKRLSFQQQRGSVLLQLVRRRSAGNPGANDDEIVAAIAVHRMPNAARAWPARARGVGATRVRSASRSRAPRLRARSVPRVGSSAPP